MPSEEPHPTWSAGLPDRGPGVAPGSAGREPGPLYAFFMASIRVEIDPLDEAVTEVVVDEASMEQPTLIVGAEGEPVSGARRDHVAAIVSRAEWPSWDYGSARFRPGA